MKHELIRTQPGDPDRCENVPCIYKKVDGANHCPRCGGAVQAKAAEQKRISTYRLAKYRTRLDEFVTDINVKSLREEIGILRILMEEKLNSLHTDMDLISSSGTISDLAIKIEKLVSSCQRIEKSMGEYLDKNQVIQLGMEMVQIIIKHVDDTDKIESIVNSMQEVIGRMLNESSQEVS